MFASHSRWNSAPAGQPMLLGTGNPVKFTLYCHCHAASRSRAYSTAETSTFGSCISLSAHIEWPRQRNNIRPKLREVENHRLGESNYCHTFDVAVDTIPDQPMAFDCQLLRLRQHVDDTIFTAHPRLQGKLCKVVDIIAKRHARLTWNKQPFRQF